MNKYLTNNLPVVNLFKKPSKKSEIVTQMIFGESFLILKKTSRWLKIKIKEDGYRGYVQNKNFSKFYTLHETRIFKKIKINHYITNEKLA